MKKILATLMTIIVTACCVSCGDDPENNPVTELSIDIENTSWEGTYVAYINSPYAGQVPMYLNWTLDFNENGEGLYVLDVESQAVEPVTTEGKMTYTYDGNNHGTLTILNKPAEFQIDAINRTLTTTLTVDADHEDNGPAYTYGGQTTLHQTR